MDDTDLGNEMEKAAVEGDGIFSQALSPLHDFHSA